MVMNKDIQTSFHLKLQLSGAAGDLSATGTKFSCLYNEKVLEQFKSFHAPP